MFFLCFSYMCGTDWRAYEVLYNTIPEASFEDLNSYVDIGYLIYCSVFNMMHIPFWIFLILTKSIVFILFIQAFRDYCPPEKYFFALFFFLAIYGYFLFIDNPLRNFIACGIFLLAQKSLRDRKLIIYCLWSLLACSFHMTALIMLPLYYIQNKQYKTSHIVAIYIIFNILFIHPDFIFYIIEKSTFWSQQLQLKTNIYKMDHIDGQGKLISFGLLSNIIFFTILCLNRKRIELLKYGNMIFLYSIFLLILFRIGLTVTVLARFQLYIAVFYSIAIAVAIDKVYTFQSMIYSIFCFLFCCVTSIHYMTRTFRYIPYTNYLLHYETKHTFEYRSLYNIEHSPYITEEEKLNISQQE